MTWEEKDQNKDLDDIVVIYMFIEFRWTPILDI